MVKMTFTVDEQTVETLRRIASRLNKPQSVVFREAIRDYAERAGRLSNDERQRMLAVLDRVRSSKSARTNADVDSEIESIRKARRAGGRRTRVE
jgi:predicted transcriptional regulator